MNNLTRRQSIKSEPSFYTYVPLQIDILSLRNYFNWMTHDTNWLSAFPPKYSFPCGANVEEIIGILLFL